MALSVSTPPHPAGACGNNLPLIHPQISPSTPGAPPPPAAHTYNSEARDRSSTSETAPYAGTGVPCICSYATSATSSARSGSQLRSFPADHRLCPPGIRPALTAPAPSSSAHPAQGCPISALSRYGSKKSNQLHPLRRRKAGTNPHMLQRPRIVIQPQQQRPYRRPLAVLVPPETQPPRNRNPAHASPSASSAYPAHTGRRGQPSPLPHPALHPRNR